MADETNARVTEIYDRITVVIIEDDDFASERIREKLDTPRIAVVACCPTAETGIQAVKEHQPHVALVDMMLERDPGAGVKVIKEIASLKNGTSCCVVTAFDIQGQYLMEAFHYGALGYWRKGYAKTQLPTIVERLANGEVTIDPVLAGLMLEYMHGPGGSMPSGKFSPPDLTERELEVLELIHQGMSNPEIAGALIIAEGTVKTHVSHIMQAFGVKGKDGRYRVSMMARLMNSQEAD